MGGRGSLEGARPGGVGVEGRERVGEQEKDITREGKVMVKSSGK